MIDSATVDSKIKIKRIEISVYRAPVETPVKTSFGVMSDRPAVLIRIEDENGAHGWGEIWCNFPGCGAEHRARILEEIFSGLIFDKSFSSPSSLFYQLTKLTHVLAIQTGEEGPISQVIAGIDIAAWDLVARRSKLPIYRMLGNQKIEMSLPVYASGVNPDSLAKTLDRCRRKGYKAFKLKIGFNEKLDLFNIDTAAQTLSKEEQLMVDANQAWDLKSAQRIALKLEKYPIKWLEEPLQADRPPQEWSRLANATRLPLAIGENLRGEVNFLQAINSKCFKFIQPDVCKWGGISGCYPVVKAIVAAGMSYCPHYLGGGVGLMASANLLASSGGNGLLEVDANDNPLKEGLAQPFPVLRNGCFKLKPGVGLGAEPELDRVKKFLKVFKEIKKSPS